jgi:hypothetical protein
VPLHDVGRWRAWLDRDRPSLTAQVAVAEFPDRLDGRTVGGAPSVPLPRLSDQPVSEMRVARLEVPGEPDVEVYYRRWYASEEVDIIDVCQVG